MADAVRMCGIRTPNRIALSPMRSNGKPMKEINDAFTVDFPGYCEHGEFGLACDPPGIVIRQPAALAGTNVLVLGIA